LTQRLAVIGYPLSHTLSPVIHGAAIHALELDLTYDAVDLPPQSLPQFITKLSGSEWLGLNVTVPHKQAVMPYLAELSNEAQAIGAVNTIAVKVEGLVGHNTDARGFLADVEDHFGPVAGKRVAVLGAGGAAHAVCYALKDLAERVWVLNRTPERAQRLADRFGLESGGMEVLSDADLIVNCTSAGLHEGDSPIPDASMPKGANLYDLIYNPAETRLMKAVREGGGKAVNGLGMLVRQAAVSFEIWTGVEPPLDVMFDAARAAHDSRLMTPDSRAAHV